MELAAQYRHALSEHVALEVYGGPAREPALGPVAYPHRPAPAGRDAHDRLFDVPSEERRERFRSLTIAWGRNREGHHTTHALLGELTVEHNRSALFVRGEMTGKSADALALESDRERVFTLGKLPAGYTRSPKLSGAVVLAAGGSVAVAVLPADLEGAYGSRAPVEFSVSLAVRPR
jgi:hypothetical protein